MLVICVLAITVALLLAIKWVMEMLLFVFVGIYYSRKYKKYSMRFSNTGLLNQCICKDDNQGGGYKKNQSFVKGLCKWVNNKVGSIPSHAIRMWCYRNILKVNMADKVVVYKGVVFRDGYKCQIGEGTIIGDDCMIDARGGLKIGCNCNFSSGVKVWTAQHSVQASNFAYEQEPVKVGDRCWISGGATILPGVEVGDGCVIASGAVVTKKCDDYGIYGGVPAKRINERNHELTYKFLGEHDWFL